MNADDLTVAVIEALNAAGIAHMLVGSFSSNYYGIPRSTQDADFVIEPGPHPVFSLRSHLGAQFKLDAQITFETVTATQRHVIDVAGTDFKVELFRLTDDPHDQARFSRRKNVELRGRPTYLPTAEDVIVTKLRWARGKDRDDVREVIAVQSDTLDWDYVHGWCDRHGTRGLLDEIRRSIPPN